MELAYPHRRSLASSTAFADVGAARAWLHTHWRNVVALAEADPTRSAVAVSGLLADYLDERSHCDTALALHELARATAEKSGDRTGEGTALNHLALIDRRQGQYEAALDKHARALAAFREVADRGGEGRAPRPEHGPLAAGQLPRLVRGAA
jgi:hypothetical protein